MTIRLSIPEEEYMRSGQVSCQGCGGTLAMRLVLKATGKKTILSIPACCWAVIPGWYPGQSLEVPLLYTAFETTGASTSGIAAGLAAKGIDDVTVVGFAGDGGTADIGIQALSGLVDRNDDVLYIMYDNEAYMNTGIQRSGSTPQGAWTTTTPVGKLGHYEMSPKKPMVDMMAAQGIPYTATTSIGYPEDVVRKVKKAISIRGSKFIQIYAPCPTGWKMDPTNMVTSAKMAVTTHMFPLYEVDGGVVNVTMKPKRTDLREYLKMQGRFRHLDDEFINNMERGVAQRWEDLLAREEYTQRKALERQG
jgi:2-oxoisovalerate ferredoxin oxidoreductase beta subunit